MALTPRLPAIPLAFRTRSRCWPGRRPPPKWRTQPWWSPSRLVRWASRQCAWTAAAEGLEGMGPARRVPAHACCSSPTHPPTPPSHPPTLPHPAQDVKKGLAKVTTADEPPAGGPQPVRRPYRASWAGMVSWPRLQCSSAHSPHLLLAPRPLHQAAAPPTPGRTSLAEPSPAEAAPIQPGVSKAPGQVSYAQVRASQQAQGIPVCVCVCLAARRGVQRQQLGFGADPSEASAAHGLDPCLPPAYEPPSRPAGGARAPRGSWRQGWRERARGRRGGRRGRQGV